MMVHCGTSASAIIAVVLVVAASLALVASATPRGGVNNNVRRQTMGEGMMMMTMMNKKKSCMKKKGISGHCTPTKSPTTMPRKTKKPTKRPSKLASKPSESPTGLPTQSAIPSQTPSRSPAPSVSPAPSGADCAAATRFPTNGHLYSLGPTLTYNEALAYAASLPKCCGKSAHLVTITSSDELSFVIGLLIDFQAFGWIGLSDIAQKGVYRWVTGEAVTLTNWGPGYPVARPGKSCVSMNFIFGDWKNLECDANFQAVVEYDCAT